LSSHLWRDAATRSPSLFGRLVFLAAFRNPATDLYEDDPLAARYGPQDTNSALSAAHHRAFLDWLQLDLSGQKQDLLLYLENLNGDGNPILRGWLRQGVPPEFIPAQANEGSRTLFLSDLEALLHILLPGDSPPPKRLALPPLLIAASCTAVALAARGLAPEHTQYLILAVLSFAIGMIAHRFWWAPALVVLLASLALVPDLSAGLLEALRNFPVREWRVPGYLVLNLGLIAIAHHLRRTGFGDRNAQRCRVILESASDGILIMNQAGRCIEANRRACEMLGYSWAELRHLNLREATGLRSLLPTGGQVAQLAPGKDRMRECSIRRQGRETVTLEAGENILSDGTVLAILRDITERKKAEERINRSLEEKELLLKEIHHRVKNNLQVVSSLLDLEASQQQQPEAVAALQHSQFRIQAIALVHQQLYQSRDLSSIELASYLQGLVEAVFQSAGPAAERVELRMAVDPVPLPLDQAVPCGLIVNELLLNCIKHAFPGDSGGEVFVTGRLLPGDVVSLSVRDTGIGIPTVLDPETGPTLGLHLVRALTRQLRGTFEICNHNGADMRISFARQFPKNKEAA
jgi:PAS domain S-box-containing protein